jgi:hypothetical protein
MVLTILLQIQTFLPAYGLFKASKYKAKGCWLAESLLDIEPRTARSPSKEQPVSRPDRGGQEWPVTESYLTLRRD